MDKLTQHKAIVRRVVTEIAEMTPSDERAETQLITDDEHGHYVLFSVGWYKKYREYLPFVHLDVRPDGKVYVQHDGTDLVIAEWLVREGIPKSEIVLAFQAPSRRAYMEEYAVE
ncbi:XisI protein [Fibrella aquatilis]|uniref:XisI protein n=1 Tax=Fibrella aquatilis TaxID=2817059 RepID=A0A939JW15_9BACT|nr:XisI protein [Fibrella aquatilis]MBO0931432.1 XisI protein [Fibrella aquatilis]